MSSPTFPDNLVVSRVRPKAVRKLPEDKILVDFGRVWFAQVKIAFTASTDREVEIRLGERLTAQGRIDPNPPGSVRHESILLPPQSAAGVAKPIIPDNRKGAHGKMAGRTVAMPDNIGQVMPFRWLEIPADAAIDPERCTMLAVHHAFDDDAAHFACDNQLLNDIFDLCKHTIKATSFAGVFVDGDRERYPREGDSYVNMLGWLALTGDTSLPKRTLEFMIEHPSHWVEYLQLLPIMALKLYHHDGDRSLIERYYEQLKAFTLIDLERGDGLIVTDQQPISNELARKLNRHQGPHVLSDVLKPLIDWPRRGSGGWSDESDGYEIGPVNAVCNAFHLQSLEAMRSIARVLGRDKDPSRLMNRPYSSYVDAFRSTFVDNATGLVRDCEGSGHFSLHASVAAALFVPFLNRQPMLNHIVQRGMACSAYFSQYLLEALFSSTKVGHAFDLLTRTDVRSWANMLRHDATITHEAWDPSLKANEDWSHAWSSAPANVLIDHVGGISCPPQPLNLPSHMHVGPTPDLAVCPVPGHLQQLQVTVATAKGPAGYTYQRGRRLTIEAADFTNPGVGLPLDLPRLKDGLYFNGRRLGPDPRDEAGR